MYWEGLWGQWEGDWGQWVVLGGGMEVPGCTGRALGCTGRGNGGTGGHWEGTGLYLEGLWGYREVLGGGMEVLSCTGRALGCAGRTPRGRPGHAGSSEDSLEDKESSACRGRHPIMPTIMAGKMEMVLPAMYIMKRFIGICFSGPSATSQQRCEGNAPGFVTGSGPGRRTGREGQRGAEPSPPGCGRSRERRPLPSAAPRSRPGRGSRRLRGGWKGRTAPSEGPDSHNPQPAAPPRPHRGAHRPPGAVPSSRAHLNRRVRTAAAAMLSARIKEVTGAEVGGSSRNGSPAHASREKGKRKQEVSP